MYQFDISQSSETSACDIDTGDTTADNRQEDEAVDHVSQPSLFSELGCDHEWRTKGARGADESRIIVWDTHSHEPDIEDEECEHAVEDWIY